MNEHSINCCLINFTADARGEVSFDLAGRLIEECRALLSTKSEQERSNFVNNEIRNSITNFEEVLCGENDDFLSVPTIKAKDGDGHQSYLKDIINFSKENESRILSAQLTAIYSGDSNLQFSHLCTNSICCYL